MGRLPETVEISMEIIHNYIIVSIRSRHAQPLLLEGQIRRGLLLDLVALKHDPLEWAGERRAPDPLVVDDNG